MEIHSVNFTFTKELINCNIGFLAIRLKQRKYTIDAVSEVNRDFFNLMSKIRKVKWRIPDGQKYTHWLVLCVSNLGRQSLGSDKWPRVLRGHYLDGGRLAEIPSSVEQTFQKFLGNLWVSVLSCHFQRIYFYWREERLNRNEFLYWASLLFLHLLLVQ